MVTECEREGEKEMDTVIDKMWEIDSSDTKKHRERSTDGEVQ